MTRAGRGLCLLLVAVALLVAACEEERQQPVRPTATLVPSDATPRSFQMGLSSLPPELTEESYERTFELVGSAADVILIQRTPPWDEMLSGDLSDETVRTTERETELAREHGLDLFVAIDPTDAAAGRRELAHLPPDLRGAGFDDERVHRAFLAYARYVAENYRPQYLALGVEINSYQRAQPEDFERFVVLYHEAYQAVKELSPETLVFPTFQLEDLQGLLPGEGPQTPQWFLLNRFEPRLDLLAVSSYPNAAFSSLDALPPSYYVQLTSFTDRPIAITGTGYPSGPESDGSGSEEEQAEFLRRALDNAQQLAMPLVVWFVAQDPTFTGEPPFNRLQHLGLRRQDGSAKAAWRLWETAARRPLPEAKPPNR